MLAAKKDGFLPLSRFKQTYGGTVIEVRDFSEPAFRMTWQVVANMLRGIAMFMSLYGWMEVEVGVFDGGLGHVGAGRVVRGGRGVGVVR